MFSKNGGDVRVVNINNCGGPNQVIKVLKNSTISFNSKCQMESRACSIVTGFETALVDIFNCFNS